MPELAFLVPDDPASEVAELATALHREVGRQDAAASLSATPPEPREDRVHVLLQGTGVGGAEALGSEPSLARTIVVLLAPPGTQAFERGVELARRSGTAFHVNAIAVERLLELGVPARHLQLGYSESWEKFGEDSAAELAVLRGRGGYFDWVGALAAIHGGAVVLHEQALGLAPLVAGRHLFVGAADTLDAIATALPRDRERLERVRAEALGFLRDALPLALAAAALIGVARALVAQPLALTDSTPGHPVLRSK